MSLSVFLCVMPGTLSAIESDGSSIAIEESEMSSPEEELPSSQSLQGIEEPSDSSSLGLGEIPSAGQAFDPKVGAVGDPQISANSRIASPLLTSNVFPYQSNPIAAVITAGLTLAFMSLKETGKVDMDGILFLLNSADFYAGIAGSVSSSWGQKGTASLLQALGRGATKLAPEMLTPLAANGALQTVGNIINGFTYTLSVTGGYEIFSQFWKISTKNIPEARKVSDFLKAPGHIQKRALLNLMYYTMMDPNLQKRVIDSIKYHRVMTYEFITMNVGLYIGAQLGNFLANKYAPGNVWAKRLAPIAGGTAMGTLFQMIPDSWKEYFNQELLDVKLSWAKDRLDEDMEALNHSLAAYAYPPKDASGRASYFMRGVDLESDIERVFRTRDLLSTLLIQNGTAHAQKAEMWIPVGESQTKVVDFFNTQYEGLQKPLPGISERIDQWLLENRSSEEIQYLSAREFRVEPKVVYYLLLMDEAKSRAKQELEEFNALVEHLAKNP